MADDRQRDPGFVRPREKLEHAGESDRLVHARAVDRALHGRPHVFLPRRAQVIAHGELAHRTVGRNDGLLERDPVKQRVVADDRVVEVDTEPHAPVVWCPSDRHPGEACPEGLNPGAGVQKQMRSGFRPAPE